MGFDAVVSPWDHFTGRSQFHDGEIRVGVGERLSLSYRSTSGLEPGKTPSPEFFGGLEWIQERGQGTFEPDPFSPGPSAGTATWVAPDSADEAVLVIRTIAQHLTMATVRAKILEPTGMHFMQTGNYWTGGIDPLPNVYYCGCGMQLAIEILPDDVSFSAIRVQEGNAAWTGSDGPFGLVGKHHNDPGQNPVVPPRGVGVDPILGSMVKGCDYAGTPDEPLELNSQTGKFTGGSAGHYEMPIPWRYTIHGSDLRLIDDARVVVDTDADGNCTITKGDSGSYTSPPQLGIPEPAITTCPFYVADKPSKP